MADQATPNPFETTGFNAFMRNHVYNATPEQVAALKPGDFGPFASAIAALRRGPPKHPMTKLRVKLDVGSPKAAAFAKVYTEAKKLHTTLPEKLHFTGSINNDTAAEISARIVEQAKAERRTDGPFHKLKDLTA